MFVFLNTNPDRPELPKETVDSLQKEHMANIDRLAKEGKLLAAGPFHGGGGIFVLNTGNVSEANGWLASDPAVRAKRWKLDVIPYRPTVGSICSVGENYEMVSYSFVRYDADTVTSDEKIKELWLTHDEYRKNIAPRDSVMAEGILGEKKGGILVVKGTLDEELLKKDPAVQQGVLKPTLKRIWIAKGSFCEKW
ncbi:MAG: hypothetical protein HYY49_01080 [Ignavibacteriales bacterium]|nr:hypothetical protein [Ignavibacteriales bacterium]